jgi:hypothetical protein
MDEKGPASYGGHAASEGGDCRDDNRGIALFICMAASVIEFASLADMCHEERSYTDNGKLIKCGNSRIAFGLAAGAASAVFCFCRLLLIKFKPDVPAMVDVVLSLFLSVWWSVATAINTSAKGALYVASNGYFGTWLALFAAAYYMVSSVTQLQSLTQRFSGSRSRGLLLLFVASVIELGVAADNYHETDSGHYHPAGRDCREFAVAVGALSAFLCVILMVIFMANVGPTDLIGKVLGTLLLGWWAAGAAVNTSSKGPFNDTCRLANGYFSSWMGFFSAVYFCFYAHYPTDLDSQAYSTMP